MPFCPACRLEYRPGYPMCSDCGIPLVDDLPREPRRRRSGSAADVVVARVHGQAFAQMWAELLGNHGIASRMNPITGVVDSVYPTDTLYEVLVAAADAPRARSILPLPTTNRIRRRPQALADEELLDDVDFALAHGDADLAEDLLSSLEHWDEDHASDSESG